MDFSDGMERLKMALHQNLEWFVIQIPNFILGILIVIIGLLITRWITRIFRKTVSHRSKDPLMINFLTKSLRVGLIILVLMFALNIAGMGNVAAGLLTAAGASAVIIGFAFKDIGENFISGVILSFNRPFDVNDTVQVGDIFGKVKSMEFRYTKIKTFDGKDVYIPNSDIIKKAVYNYTEDGYARMDFVVGMAYEDDLTEGFKLLTQAIKSVDGVVDNDTHESFVTVDELTGSTVKVRVYFWVHTLEYRRQSHQIKSDVVSIVKETIINNGMSIPADIREHRLYGSQKSIPIDILNTQKFLDSAPKS